MVNDLCEVKRVNLPAVKKVSEKIKNFNNINESVETFKIMSDLTRLKILYALSFGELCVCDISCAINITQSATSHQLRTLRTAKLVKYRKEGRIAHYSLSDSHVKTLLSTTIKHAQH